MAAEQGMGTGWVPGLNTERIDSTTIPADELARVLRSTSAASVEAQASAPAGTARRCRPARKAGAACWGSAYALTVTFTPGRAS